MEIERKFLVAGLPKALEKYAHEELSQGYLSTEPVVRVRREGETYYLTYKGAGMLARREENLPLTPEAYEHLLAKADGIIIQKTRYLIAVEELDRWTEDYTPTMLTHAQVGGGRVCELDVFHGDMEGLVLAEIEFDTEEQAAAFSLPAAFTEDVTMNPQYHNSYMSKYGWKA